MALPVDSAAKIQCNTAEAPARIWRVESAGRLEVFLQECMPDASRESIRRALAAGACRVDGEVRRLGFRLTTGAAVVLDEGFRLTEVRPEAIALEVLYQDDELVAVNKPAGMLAHPTSRERMGTVANALRGMGFLSAHILHRLDRDTSGVLLAAKSLPRHSPLAKLFGERKVEKRYLAVVAGPVGWEETAVNLPIGRDPNRRPPWDVSLDGAPSQTRLRVLERGEAGVLLEAEPVTGRTNQIRIHLAALGMPICGDRAYGGRPAGRLMLHASTLLVPGKGMITAPAPSEFKTGFS